MQTQSPDQKTPPNEPVDALWSPPWWRADVHGDAWKRVHQAVEKGWRTQRLISKSEAVVSRPLQSHDEHVGKVDQSDRAYNAQLQARSKVESTNGDRRFSAPADERPQPFGFDGRDLDDETALRFGVAARQQYGASHANWNADIEKLLRAEWTATSAKPRRPWMEALPQIRYGYEFQSDATA